MIAVGKVGVETRDQVVEHIDGGAVREILVCEGGRVKAGDVLVRFDFRFARNAARERRGPSRAGADTALALRW